MSRWKTSFIYTTPLKTFKVAYIFGAIGGLIGVANAWLTVYHDKKLNALKWLGVITGAIIQTGVLALVYACCNIWYIRPVGIILFIAYIIHIVLFGIFVGRTKKDRVDDERDFYI